MVKVNVSPPFKKQTDIRMLERIKSTFIGRPVRVIGPLEKTANWAGKNFCQSHRFDITIGADYGIYPCCPTAYKEEYMLVNLHDFASFEEAWNSSSRKKWMKRFLPPCQDCWLYPVNERIMQIKENVAH